MASSQRSVQRGYLIAVGLVVLLLIGGILPTTRGSASGDSAFYDVGSSDSELWKAAWYVKQNGIFEGYDGALHPWEPMTRRHVALVLERAGRGSRPNWTDDYQTATRGEVLAAFPGLAWTEERWSEKVLRSQVVRLIYRGRADLNGALPSKVVSASLPPASQDGAIPEVSEAFDVSTYGATGDGRTNDTAAIQRAIDAAARTFGTVTFPAGTFRVESTLYLKSNVTVSGVAGQTVLSMPAKSSATALFYGSGLSNVTLQNLTLRSTGPQSWVYGISTSGMQASTLRNLRFEDLQFGMKLGGGNLSTGWLVEDIVARHTRAPLYLGDVHDSTFRRLDLEGAGTDATIPRPLHLHQRERAGLVRSRTSA